jgi:GH25 family lysozyme M1 (1,4-beta-N-acetylmuramidase)
MNWVSDNTNKSLRDEAQRVLDNHKKKLGKRKCIYVKVKDTPPTWKCVYEK